MAMHINIYIICIYSNHESLTFVNDSIIRNTIYNEEKYSFESNIAILNS